MMKTDILVREIAAQLTPDEIDSLRRDLELVTLGMRIRDGRADSFVDVGLVKPEDIENATHQPEPQTSTPVEDDVGF